MVGRKVALITDTHFGIRKGSQIFHDYFNKFYSEVFFPELESRGIDTVIHLGDCFDVRKGIDYWSLNWAKDNFFTPLQERGIQLHLIVGNHDIFYKESLSINSPGLNLQEYDNVTIYQEPGTATISGSPIFMVPWICESNAEQFSEELAYSEAKVCMGHLELAGFYANKDYKCQHGTDSKIFSEFDRVFSGHFHKKNTSGNITYLGNPYQLYWNDEGDTRGFHIFDLETLDLEFIENPNTMFHKISYNEEDRKLINPNKYKNSYVKVIVEGKSTPQKLSKVVDSLYDTGIHDIKVIETIDYSIDDDVEVEAEDTLTTFTNYVEAMDDGFNKSKVISIFKSLYVEAQEV
jgi:DNA repair exonuclease SbcCD nuclease subunit